MRKLFAYILASVTLAACTSEDMLVEEIDVQEQEEKLDSTSVRVHIEEPVVWSMPGSRSSIYYDKSNASQFSFMWGADDAFAVYPYNPNDQAHSNGLKFEFVKELNQSAVSLTRTIKPAQGVSPLVGNAKYVACFPYTSAESYSSIPVSYTGQTQTSNVNISVYFDNFTSKPDSKTTYLASEKDASAHLGAYDYLIAKPTQTRSFAGVDFDMRRVGAISRFYIRCPETDADKDNVYESLQLYNGSLDFIETATMDASVENVASALNTPTTSHVITLKLGEGENGLDFSYKDGVPVNKDYFYYSSKNENYIPYLIAYIMMAPVDFRDKDCSTLYLIAHEKSHPENKHYYKAEFTDSQKPNLIPNLLYRWTLTPGIDLPIEFTETTVEEWSAGPGFYNDGKGTETW